MTYLQQYELTVHEEFRGRVKMALMAAANLILNELDTVEHAAARKALARVVIENPDMHVNRFLSVVAANPSIAAAGPVSSSDNDLDFVIASYFTIIALQVT